MPYNRVAIYSLGRSLALVEALILDLAQVSDAVARSEDSKAVECVAVTRDSLLTVRASLVNLLFFEGVSMDDLRELDRQLVLPEIR